MLSNTLKPASTAEVQACMRLACEQKVRVYPISTARPFNGDSNIPWADNCVLMDLSAMNQILDFNEELGFVVIEPGVTQQQLVEFLKAKNSKLMPALTGSFRESSLMGNALERGDAFGAYGERALYVSDFEVVLPNGDLYHTDQPCGPNLEGLFFQSNLGIVTQMRLWLEPKPDFYHQILCGVESFEELSKAVDVLRTLQQKRIISYASIWNSQKVRAKLGDSQIKLPKWIISVPLFAFDADQAAAQIKIAEQALGMFKDLVMKPAEFEFEKHENLNVVESGLLWVTCQMAYQGSRVIKAVELAEQVLWDYGFEPRVSLIATHTRHIKLVISITYERGQPELDARAQHCHDEILKNLIQIDCPPFRLGLQSQWASPENTLFDQIKHHLDAEQLLSPGHYQKAPNHKAYLK